MPKFICISGKARHGKDTTAAMIAEHFEKRGKSVLITHFADLLKYICKTFFAWDGDKNDRGRTLLQYVGTDCVRSYNPDFWVNFVTSIATVFPSEWDYVIVPDTRFKNELTRIKELFPATHIRVERLEFDNGLTEEQKGHQSEIELVDELPDIMLYNESLEQLWDETEKICEDLLRKEDQVPYQLTIFDNVPPADGA